MIFIIYLKIKFLESFGRSYNSKWMEKGRRKNLSNFIRVGRSGRCGGLIKY